LRWSCRPTRLPQALADQLVAADGNHAREQ